MSAFKSDTAPLTIALDITACEREQIHVPGAIQPHGILLVIDPISLEIVAGAGDIETQLDSDWLWQIGQRRAWPGARATDS